eukprot:TRINITY_DN75333_c0_g1_i1.p1 TRINITY_DN75333_c0_g1~~TRINITY_DN75333_c0_g1_i1.p1  ORF type:complete len:1189 (-),score=179.03 TRINITY_DN75333_c0_g1_i1:33-3545(-)
MPVLDEESTDPHLTRTLVADHGFLEPVSSREEDGLLLPEDEDFESQPTFGVKVKETVRRFKTQVQKNHDRLTTQIQERLPEEVQEIQAKVADQFERGKFGITHAFQKAKHEVRDMFEPEDPLAPEPHRMPELVHIAPTLSGRSTGGKTEGLKYTARLRLPDGCFANVNQASYEWCPKPFTCEEALEVRAVARQEKHRPRPPRILNDPPGPRRGICIRCFREFCVLFAWVLVIVLGVAASFVATMLLRPILHGLLQTLPASFGGGLADGPGLEVVSVCLSGVMSLGGILLLVRFVVALPSFVLPAKLILKIEQKDETDQVRNVLLELLTAESLAVQDVCAFLGVSAKTIRGGKVMKEGKVMCRCHDTADTVLGRSRLRRISCVCCHCYWRCVGGFWPDGEPLKSRWAVLTLDGIAVYRSLLEEDPTDLLLFDTSFTCWSGHNSNGHEIFVATSGRVLELVLEEEEDSGAWLAAVTHAANMSRRTKEQRFSAFSPLLGDRGLIGMRWLICGRAAFRRMAQAIKLAKREIFIAGLMLTPNLPLTREEGREQEILADLLAEKAELGVKIFVLIWHEAEAILYNDSEGARMELITRHRDNINVMRHRSRFGSNAYWTHHEKLVVIDQAVAFVGGIDLALGRYDTPRHNLIDPECTVFPGKDYYNPRLRDFKPYGEVRDMGTDTIDRTELPRMPWQDVHCQLLGTPAAEVAWHFAQRWNHARQAETYEHQPISVPQAFAGGIAEIDRSVSGRSLTRSYSGMNAGTWTNVNVPQPTEALGQGRQTLQVLRESSEASKNLQRASSDVETTSLLMHRTLTSEGLGGDELLRGCADCSMPAEWPPEEGPLVWDTHIQVLRSSSRWSAGVGVECSIHTAYCHFIQCAKNFIVIENQFWCSGMDGDDRIGNRVSEALYARIARANQDGETFHVYVVLPLVPAFEGPLSRTSSKSYTMLSVMDWQIRTIRQLQMRIREELKSDADQYLTVLALRRWAERTDGALISEQVYVHSKVMVVDDEVAIIGSANINDRSMLGIRDSEVCISVEGAEFARSLREALFAQHLGWESQAESVDLLAPSAPNQIGAVADSNTAIFEEVFKCLPSDTFKTWAQVEALRSGPGGPQSPLDAAVVPSSERDASLLRLKALKGQVVRYPSRFLEDEETLVGDGSFISRLVPLETYT